MSEAHLNALLDRYLHKYTPTASQASTALGTSTFAATVAAQNHSTNSFASTQQQQQQERKYDPPPSSASSFAASLHQTNPTASSTLSPPATMFHQTDLSIIQTQIENLSKKLHRVPESVLVDPLAPTQTQTVQPPQPQLHMHELDQSVSQPAPIPPYDPQRSIVASMIALSPPRTTSTTSAFTLPPPPSSSPASSPLKARLATFERTNQKQSLQLSEKEFALQSALREVASLKTKVDKLKQSQVEHDSLKREYEVLKSSLARSEKIRREQIGYIQLLHTQISFLQGSSNTVLESPSKPSGGMQTPKFVMSPISQFNGTSTSAAGQDDFASVPGVKLVHMNGNSSSSFSNDSHATIHALSPQRSSIPSRVIASSSASSNHTGIWPTREDANEVAEAAREGAAVLAKARADAQARESKRSKAEEAARSQERELRIEQQRIEMRRKEQAQKNISRPYESPVPYSPPTSSLSQQHTIRVEKEKSSRSYVPAVVSDPDSPEPSSPQSPAAVDDSYVAEEPPHAPTQHARESAAAPSTKKKPISQPGSALKPAAQQQRASTHKKVAPSTTHSSSVRIGAAGAKAVSSSVKKVSGSSSVRSSSVAPSSNRPATARSRPATGSGYGVVSVHQPSRAALALRPATARTTQR